MVQVASCLKMFSVETNREKNVKYLTAHTLLLPEAPKTTSLHLHLIFPSLLKTSTLVMYNGHWANFSSLEQSDNYPTPDLTTFDIQTYLQQDKTFLKFMKIRKSHGN